MSDLKDRLRALYKRMSLREKLLSLLFVLVILFLWSNNWLTRLSDGMRNANSPGSSYKLNSNGSTVATY